MNLYDDTVFPVRIMFDDGATAIIKKSTDFPQGRPFRIIEGRVKEDDGSSVGTGARVAD